MAATREVARLDATQAREQLQAILSGVADAVTAQAPDGRLLFANDAALELLGFESFEELEAERRSAGCWTGSTCSTRRASRCRSRPCRDAGR